MTVFEVSSFFAIAGFVILGICSYWVGPLSGGAWSWLIYPATRQHGGMFLVGGIFIVTGLIGMLTRIRNPLFLLSAGMYAFSILVTIFWLQLTDV